MCILIYLALLLSAVMAVPAPSKGPGSKGPPCNKAAFFLAGDSTTAQQSAGGGGWGNGFLTTLTNGNFGMNYGHNGATTVSFRNGGDWARVLAKVNQSTALDYETFVTIQFGHNDQKAAANINITTFMANLERMATEVQTAGGIPIFVTSLTRRNFNSTTNLVIKDLEPQVNATLAVAKANKFHFIDLNEASMEYVNRMGENKSHTYNLATTENTHLNAPGSMLFGNMVSVLLRGMTKEMGEWTVPNKTIERAIDREIYLYPEVKLTNGVWVNSTAPAGFSY